MSPADQPQAIDWRRSTDPPTLWLSLALGSVLIHLVIFILVSVVLTRTAKVQLDAEPIAVEFVDPTTNPVQARSATPSRAIAARPSQTVPNASANRQAPLTTQIPQASLEPRRSVEQPIAPLPPVKRRPLPLRTRQPQPFRNPLPSQPDPAPNSTQPQPNPFRNSLPQQPDRRDLTQPQPAPSNPFQTGLPGAPPNPSGNPDPQPGGSQAPAESGTEIAQQPGGNRVAVVISNPRQPSVDRQQQPAKPKEQQKTVSIYYSGAIAQLPSRSMSIEVPLTIDSNGRVVDIGRASLLSPASSIDQEELDNIADQIFKTWEFEPAQNLSGDNAPLKPLLSNLTVDAQIQFP
ncbi:hypothetical protein [Stenomitos frigidus]|uniref:Uncharacterized protein n=1 Tax=Stenomitos frigidus ULC18 TaxID=2107698 RepID=A0A2T1ER70_9CYAN|nr:hypothetical protein [Stenomitos frigidus]PSB35240.1 hypothetical protein C7B82_01140 [Stenomitos frigidus ULC18]